MTELARDKLYSVSDLKDRGWTITAIAKFLPEPDHTVPNPHYRNAGAPMKFWTKARVHRTEKTKRFLAWKDGVATRRNAAKDAVVTREANMVERMEQAEITIRRGLTFDEIRALALRTHGGNYRGDPGLFFWSRDKGVAAIRHRLTNYEDLWKICNRGTTGERAYLVLRWRVDKLIDEAYPDFADDDAFYAAERRRRMNPPGDRR